MTKRRMTPASAAVGFIMFLLLWQLLSLAVMSDIVPAPSVVLPIFFRGIFGELGLHFLASLGRVLASILIAVVTAAPLGLLLGQSPVLNAVFSPLIAILYPIPKIVFLPVIYVLMGITDVSKIILISVIIFFQILVVVRDEALNLRPELILSVRSLGAGRRALFRFVYLPACIPAVLTALRVSIGTAVAVLFIAEQSLTTYGLGYYIVVETYQVLMYPEMFSGILGMGVLGTTLFFAVTEIEKRFGRHLYIDNDINPEKKETMNNWIMAFRPKTLPAAVAPIIVGSAAAYADDRFMWPAATAALLGILLLQIGVNLANDYFDHIKGVDTEERLGPVRVTQSGLIPAAKVKLAMIICLGAAVLVGLYLIAVGGPPIVLIGIFSILAALGYSGGPYPLASNGLGDIAVFVFFGLIAVCGTYYVQALTVTSEVFGLSAAVGFLITAILVVNNYRDIKTDEKAGKKTLAVMIGEKNTRLEFNALIYGAYGVIGGMWAMGILSKTALLVLFSLPLAIGLTREMRRITGSELNAVLAKTAKLSLIFCALLSLGLVLG